MTYQDRPVKYGSVIFLSADKTARSGVIESDATYTIEDVPMGAVKIAVISRDPKEGPFRRARSKARSSRRKMGQTGKTAVEGWFPLPRMLETPRTSGLELHHRCRRRHHDIDLK